MLEQPAEPLATDHRPVREAVYSWLAAVRDPQRYITPALVRAFLVVVLDELFHDMPQVPLAAHDEVIEQLDP